MAYDYDLMRIEVAGRALWATIDAPPINLMTLDLYRELEAFSAEVAADDDILAVVLQSANPEFFIAHFDVEVILEFPVDGEAVRATELGGFHAMCERFRTMRKATIAKVAGRVGGGGSELVASCDMRFGATGRAIVNQMEVPIGLLPGGTGTQRLPRLLGPGRAMELVLGGIDLDAETGERWGYFNRVLDEPDLDVYVDWLARRIASFPAPAVRLAKRSMLNALPDPTPGLLDEAYLFQQVLRTVEAPETMRRFLAAGGQTAEAERRMERLTAEINDG